MGWVSKVWRIIFFVGAGVNLHAVANELYYKGGYAEILSFQGEYVGLAMMVLGYWVAYMMGLSEKYKRVEAIKEILRKKFNVIL